MASSTIQGIMHALHAKVPDHLADALGIGLKIDFEIMP